MHSRCALLFFVTTAFVISCGEPQSNRKKVYPVSGKVLVKKVPADKAMVVFHPIEAEPKSAIRPLGICGPDGTFNLTTYLTNDGAPEGEYRVTIIWPGPPPKKTAEMDDEGPDRLKGRYGNPQTSRIKIVVEPKPMTLEPFYLD